MFGNLAHEFGIFEKQSSFFTQGVAGLNTIEGNIAYNGFVQTGSVSPFILFLVQCVCEHKVAGISSICTKAADWTIVYDHSSRNIAALARTSISMTDLWDKTT